MFLGSANLGEVAHFISTMGFFNLIFISCVPLILYFTRVEHLGSLSSLPWGYLFGLAGLWLGEKAYISLAKECHRKQICKQIYCILLGHYVINFILKAMDFN